MNDDIKVEPKTDQLNGDHLIAGPVTVTIGAVTDGTDEQPYNLELIEYPGKPYRPNKSMLKVLIQAWTNKRAVYVGRKLTLYRDPNVLFGRNKVGGIRISHMSHIDKPITLTLALTRGKWGEYTVQPLIESDNPWIAHINAATDIADLQRIWADANTAGATREPAVIKAKDNRKAALDHVSN